jgi:hypothetical protein
MFMVKQLVNECKVQKSTKSIEITAWKLQNPCQNISTANLHQIYFFCAINGIFLHLSKINSYDASFSVGYFHCCHYPILLILLYLQA